MGGKAPPAVQPAVMGAVVTPRVPTLNPWIMTFAYGETSPNVGARNDVPHAPLIVRPTVSLNGAQLNAILGLLVPWTSLYWSCRHEASNSKRRKPGRPFISPKTGTLSWVKTAHTWRDSGSCR